MEQTFIEKLLCAGHWDSQWKFNRKESKKRKKSDNSFPVGDISKQIATQIIYNNSCYKSNGTWDT